MIFTTVVVGDLEVNCYILAEEEGSGAVIIDPGDDEKEIRKTLDKFKLKPGIVINTHAHIDHIGLDDKFNVPVYVHEQDAEALFDADLNFSNFLMRQFKISPETKVIKVKDKDTITFGNIELEVIHTPGHSPGGMSLLLRKPQSNILFSGDSLFYRSVGRTDFPGANGEMLISAIKDKLLVLPEQTKVFPGHGPSSTIANEAKNNPFLE